MNDKILITSALPYANGPLHFGHIAGAYLPADCYARYQRLQKKEVLFLSGSDEYGVAISLSAQVNGRSPKEHAEIYHQINKEFFKKLDISFDHYSRTTWTGHKKTSQEFFLDLYNNGYIEEREENHLYSKEEKRFLADRYVIGTCPKCGYDKARGDECQKCSANYEAIQLINPKSKLTGSNLEKKKSKHWYLRFDKFKEKLNSWIKEKNWKSNVVNFTMNYIKDLKMRCVTRDETWGIPVPIEGSDGKVLYVWFDAPIGYISAAKEWSEKIGEKEKWKEFWLDQKTKLVNFIGKDNIPFHTLFFPAMVMGQNKEFKLVDEVPANEFLLLEGKQFSKSDGWYIDLEEFFSNFTSDQVRYYLAAIAPETSDSEFIWKDFQTRCNSELLGKFGNFIHRTLVFAKNNCSSKSPSIENPDDLDNQFLKDIDSYIDQISEAYENFHLIKASQLIMELAHKGNVYFDKKKPWKLAKDESFQEQMNTIIACCLSCIKALALISSPIIPKTSQNVWELIGYKTELSSKLWKEIKDKKIPAGQLLPPPKVLFRKIEDEEIEKEIKKLGKMSEKKEEESCSSKEEISYKDFQRLDMRVGKIIQADKIEKSKKLIKLIVDIGSEKRQIVSGIFPSYSPEDLIGKQVIVLINLKPVKLMNIESQGMILAAGDDSNLELPFVHGQKPGSIVC